MKHRATARIALTLIAVLALVAASCSSDSDTATTEATTTTQATTTTEATGTTQATTTTEATTSTVETFDVVAAVNVYASTIPEGYSAVGDIEAFKDAVEASGALLIDVREVGEYEEGHLEGAVNIPLRTLGESLDKIPTDRQVFIYCMSGHRAGMGLSSLGMLGYDNVTAFPPGYAGWTAAGEPVTTEVPTAETYDVPDIPEELYEAVDTFLTTIPEGWLSAGDVSKVKDAMNAGSAMLDVRTADEYAVGHIPGAANIPLREIAARYGEIPADAAVISYCKSGHRQAMSIPIMHVLGNITSKGFPASYNGWVDANEPVETTA